MAETKVLNGSEIVIECLKEQGVKTVFGYPGGTILNIYDALYKHQDEITHILTSHEQGAAHAADGYARATGKVGVCMATSGPGATNLVTGIATAYMDSIPVVAITCNVGVDLLGKDSFQEVDISGVTMPITKYNFIVKDISRLAYVIRRAFTIAQSGRPGPVLIDITKNVTAAEYEYTPMEPEPITRQTDTILEEDMETALELIRNSRKPFIFVGGGAVLSDASEELRTLAHRIQAPVADSLMGKGAFDGSDELYTGMVGMHGTKTSNFGITECDLLIVAGARFSDRVTGNASKFAKNAKILQIDVDPAEINKNIRTHASIVGDLKTVLRKLNARLDPINHDEWVAHIERMKDMYPLRYDKNLLTGPSIIETIDELTHGDAVLKAGGLLIQPLPGCTEETLEQLELRTPMFADISRELTFENPEGLMAGWFQGMDPRILERTTIAWGCGCSRDRMEKALISLGRKELEELSNDPKGAELGCHFCHQHYTFTPAQLKELLARATRP